MATMSPGLAGLLGFTSNLAAAGGPSRIPMNAAQAIGHATQGGLAGYAQAMQMQRAQQQDELRHMEALLRMRAHQDARKQGAADRARLDERRGHVDTLIASVQDPQKQAWARANPEAFLDLEAAKYALPAQMTPYERQRLEIQRGNLAMRQAENERRLNQGPVPQFGTIPSGHALVQTEAGEWMMTPVPGSPDHREMEQAAGQQAEQRKIDRTDAEIMLRDTGRAIDQIDNSILPAAGAIGGTLNFIPGTPGFQLDKTLDSIRANVGFDKLQQLRAASPTGGALGQVSERENVLLQSSLGSLNQAQDPEVLRENLMMIRRLELDAYFGSPEELAQAVADGRMTAAQAERAMNERRQFERGESQPAPQSSPAPQAGGAQPGMVVGGYRFSGGDPNDQSNWQRIR